ncbi:cHAP domain./Lectin C-type domain [Clostridium sp. CAG:921]|nr:cHAP domain./Lectin C-type domain [Clostridium sp. CAG:921]
MYIIDFFNKYNGKYVDTDGMYGAQCMDLYNKYQKEVMGVKPRGAQYAYLVWNNFDEKNFVKIKNTLEFIPVLGDVAVWGNSNLKYGHVSICSGNGDINSFESFDQNFPIGSSCHFEKHNYYNGFLGVLRPKVGDIRKENDSAFWVRVDKKEAAVRSSPTTKANLVGSKILKKGDTFKVSGTVIGESVSGNNIWYKSLKGNYVWSGGINKM